MSSLIIIVIYLTAIAFAIWSWNALFEWTHYRTPEGKHDYKLIQTVIRLLRDRPDFFSARWIHKDHISDTLHSQDKSILIDIETGRILLPTEPHMTRHQRRAIIKLVKPIVKRDSDDLVEGLINKFDHI